MIFMWGKVEVDGDATALQVSTLWMDVAI
jgi:hypothetical protein